MIRRWGESDSLAAGTVGSLVETKEWPNSRRVLQYDGQCNVIELGLSMKRRAEGKWGTGRSECPKFVLAENKQYLQHRQQPAHVF